MTYWAAYCQKAGLGMPSYAHGIKLDDGTKASDYVTKWGLELSLIHISEPTRPY